MDPFFAGGFLFDPKTKRILLHKRDNNTQNNPGLWAFFGGMSENNETPIETFTRELQEELGIKINKEIIKELTNYFNPDFHVQRFVFYAEMSEQTIFNLNEGEKFGWFEFEEAMKLEITLRTRNDLKRFANLFQQK